MAKATTRTKPPPRRRNAAATRQAILASARQAFLRWGYDGAGVREIAAGAGVTAMLVNRYFGSKEQLFAEVMAATAAPKVLTPKNLESPNLGEMLATMLVGITEAGETPLDGFLIMLRSASSARAAELGRKHIEDGHQKNLRAALRGALAPQRAALVLSLISGFQVMRQMVRLTALADAEPEPLVRLLAPLIQQLIDDPAPVAKRRPHRAR